MSESSIKLIIQAVLALVLIVGMIWIILTPTVTDEIAKAALVVVSSAAGYLFAKHT